MKNRSTTSFEDFGIIEATSENTSRLAFENAARRSEDPTWASGRCRQLKVSADSGGPDVKATALLKLVYLEMFGHDMSWAAFNVLEVMSSSKYPQKRVGYLGAVQSFRPDTEVLMLATNLLKKVGDPSTDV